MQSALQQLNDLQRKIQEFRDLIYKQGNISLYHGYSFKKPIKIQKREDLCYRWIPRYEKTIHEDSCDFESYSDIHSISCNNYQPTYDSVSSTFDSLSTDMDFDDSFVKRLIREDISNDSLYDM